MGNAPPASADSTVVLRAELAGICGGVLLGELGGDASTLRDGEPPGGGPLPHPRRPTRTTPGAAAPTAAARQGAPAPRPAPRPHGPGGTPPPPYPHPFSKGGLPG